MKKYVAVDSQFFKEAEPVLDEMGIDLDTVVKMTLKKIAREKDLTFLMNRTEPSMPSAVPPIQQVDRGTMSKNVAVQIFREHGFHFSRNITFASKNRSANNYWANPYFFSLDSEWQLILNDWIKRELHLFIIPARSIAHNQMVPRVDQPDKIDLQIGYGDPTFTDNRSKISFARYRVRSIRY